MTRMVPLQSYAQNGLSVWSIDEGRNALMRGSMLSSKSQTEGWLRLIRGMSNEKKRWMSLQLAMPDTEWPIITMEHFYLEGSWIPHIVVPTPLVSPPKREEARSDLQWKTIWKFIQQINCEGWLFYSEWLDDEMEEAMTKFYKDATEEFQVEATLKDFHHEITSYLLRDYRVNCAKLVMQLGMRSQDGGRDRQSEYELETEIVRMHFEILNNLNTQRDVLNNIKSCIERIQHLHPELIPLKHSVHLLATLLGPPQSWIQSLLYMGLLNHQLGVGMYVHCDSGFDRTNLAFAVQLALKEMLGKHSIGELLSFAEEYKENAQLCVEFKNLTWEYLSEVCTPLTQSNAVWSKWTPDKIRVNAFLDGNEQKAL